jgi:mannan endo-1,4-beta-mannosidase
MRHRSGFTSLGGAVLAATVLAVFGIVVALADVSGKDARRHAATVYWGAYVSGAPYGGADAPWDMRSVARFEANAHKRMSLLEWGQAWWECSTTCGLRPFRADLMQRARLHGYIPVLSWDSEHEQSGPDDPAFALRAIIAGRYDRFLRRWARGARRWGRPFFLRFDWEMNTNGVPYSEHANGNRAGDFVRMWRHVHGIFDVAGARNVTWVWCPNVDYADAVHPLRSLYPGDAYVDWTCLDGYNWGTNPAAPAGWRSFDETFHTTYKLITQRIAPTKPLMIGETAASEYGGSKADWITDALTDQLPRNYPRARALVWFNKNADGMDWVIESSSAAQAAFAAGIAAPRYAPNAFAAIGSSPIRPLDRRR